MSLATFIKNFTSWGGVRQVAGKLIPGPSSDAVVWAVLPTVFRETFKRPDTALGTLGGGWALKGPYAGSYPLPSTSDGQLVLGAFEAPGSTTVYATRTLDATPSVMQVRMSWTDLGSNSGYQTFAAIITNSANIIDTMLHITLTHTTLKLQKRVSGGSFVDLVPPYDIQPRLSLAGGENVMTVRVTGDTVFLQLNGLPEMSATDADISSIVGPIIVVESAQTAGTTRYKLRVLEVSAHA